MASEASHDLEPSLIAYIDGKEVFRSSKKWLHPLLDLSRFLERSAPSGRLTTYDRIVGRASALLSARLGVTKIRAKLVSRRAIEALEHFEITVEADGFEERLVCSTEDLLKDSLDPEFAFLLVSERAMANTGTNTSTPDHS